LITVIDILENSESAKVLIKCYGDPDDVFLPQSESGWDEISRGFEEKLGIPNIAGAIDGSLFEVQRSSNQSTAI
jgi:hypothetical protein